MRKLTVLLLTTFFLGLHSCDKIKDDILEEAIDTEQTLIGNWELTGGRFNLYKNRQLIHEENVPIGQDQSRQLRITEDRIYMTESSGNIAEETEYSYSHVDGKINTIWVTNMETNVSNSMEFEFISGELELLHTEYTALDEVDELGYDEIEIYERYKRVL